MLAAAAAHLLGIILVSAVIAVAERRLSAPQLPQTLAISLVGATATTCLGLAGVVLVERDPVSGLLLVAPVIACGFAFRGYMAQREQREHVEFLYESMRATQSAPDFAQAIGQLLGSARRLLRAEYAEILLLSLDTGGPPIRGVSVDDGQLLMDTDERRTPGDELALRVAGAGRAALLGRRREPHLLDGVLASRNLDDAIVGALRGDDGPFGLLIVGDRAGDVTTFGDDDLDLFETFAGHAGILLENGRLEHSLAKVTELKDELKHQAYHDTLTGLPNRFHFVESLAEPTQGARAGHPDRGPLHRPRRLQVGERHLGAPRRGRAARAGRRSDQGRRSRRRSPCEARRRRVRRARRSRRRARGGARRRAPDRGTRRSFALTACETSIHASIGIAISGPGAETAEDLIRNADLAMYTSKEGERRPIRDRPRVARAYARPRVRGRARRDRRAVSADRLAEGRRHPRVRGTRALASPGARTAGARRLHRCRRVDVHPDLDDRAARLGGPDEVGRQQQPALGVVPAHERLERVDAAVRQRDDRLIPHVDLTALDRERRVRGRSGLALLWARLALPSRCTSRGLRSESGLLQSRPPGL